jgi:hypothetical protein
VWKPKLRYSEDGYLNDISNYIAAIFVHILPNTTYMVILPSTIPAIAWIDPEDPQKSSVRTAAIQAKI